MYEDTEQYPSYDEEGGPEVISTSQAINLTCTLASLSGLFALFLCFADQRSRAVRRFSVQSVGLLVAEVAIGMVCWILSAFLGWIPLLGNILSILLFIVFLAGLVLALVLRVKMMLSAYRGIAYTLPAVGQMLRKYE